MAFENGNKLAQEWTLENALPRFEDALKRSENDECLCMQDAIRESGIPRSTFYQLAKDQPVLDSIKEKINDNIIIRINKLALDRISPAPASPAIWRMKQLGERDEQHINTTGNTTQTIIVADKETAKEIEKLKERFENE
jgi:hypothetical protein